MDLDQLFEEQRPLPGLIGIERVMVCYCGFTFLLLGVLGSVMGNWWEPVAWRVGILAVTFLLYRFYQKLLGIKKTNQAAIFGKVEEYSHDSRKIIAYSREYEGNRLFVVGNFSKHPVEYRLPGWTKYAETLLDNYGRFSAESGTVTLRPYEAAVLEVKI